MKLKSEEGQTIVFAALMMPVLLGILTLVLETGNWMLIKRALQGDADAAALAAVRELPASQSMATSVAQDYVEVQNAEDQAEVDSVTITNSNSRIKVVVKHQVQGSLIGVLGVDPPLIRATATAQISQAIRMKAGLPFALMRDSYTLHQNFSLDTAGTSSSHGAISPPHGTSCSSSSGGNDYRDMIKTEKHGGFDACGLSVGDLVGVQTGNLAGPTEAGFSARIGTNTDSFTDVFEYDAATESYIVKKPSSPRLVVIPVVESSTGTNSWPSGSSGQVKVLRYTFGYLGKTDTAGYPVTTQNGRKVWMTVVRAILPPDYETPLGDYIPGSDAPVVIRLVE